MYAENRGATCENCKNRGVIEQCRKCQRSDNRRGWEPAEGVQVRLYEVWHGKKRGVGREVINQLNMVDYAHKIVGL